MGYYPDNKEEREAFIAWTNHENIYFEGINPDSLNDMKRIYIVEEDGELKSPFESDPESEQSEQETFEANREKYFNEEFFKNHKVYVHPFGSDEPKRIRTQRIGEKLVFTSEEADLETKKKFAEMKKKTDEKEIVREKILHRAETMLQREAHDEEAYRELFGYKNRQSNIHTYAEMVRGTEKSGLVEKKMNSKPKEDLVAAFTVLMLFARRTLPGTEKEQNYAVLEAPQMLADLMNQNASDLKTYSRRIHEARNQAKVVLDGQLRSKETLNNAIMFYALCNRKFQMDSRTGMVDPSWISKILPGRKVLEFLDGNSKVMDRLNFNNTIDRELAIIRAQSAAYDLAMDQAKNMRNLFGKKEPDPEDAKKMMMDVICDEIMMRAFASETGKIKKAEEPLTSIEKIFADKKSKEKVLKAIRSNKKIIDIVNDKQNLDNIRSYMTVPEYRKLVEAGAETLQKSLEMIMNGKALPDFEEKKEIQKQAEELKVSKKAQKTDKISTSLKDSKQEKTEPASSVKTITEMIPDVNENSDFLDDNKENAEVKAEILKKNIQEQLQISRKAKNYLTLADRFLGRNSKLKNSFNEFNNEMNNLVSLISSYEKKDKDGKEYVLNNAELWEIKTKFAAVQKKADSLLVSSKKAGLGEKTAFYRSIETVDRILTKDMKTFDHLQADHQSSLKQLLNQAQSEVVDISKFHVKKVGKKMSERIPIAVPRKVNGNIVFQKGMFTAEKNADPEQAFFKLVEEYDTPDLCQKAFESLEYTLRICHVGQLEFFERLWDNKKGVVSFPDIFKSMYPELEEWFKNFGKKKPMQEFIKKAAQKLITDHQLIDNGFPRGGNVEQRNCAMSAVAELLNMSGSIAESVPMTVWDGKNYIRGSFMKYADGIDLSNIETDHPVTLLEEKKISVSALISASNIHVLDFICGQFDRHRENVFWQFRNNVVTAVQGIDNDSSFVELSDNVLSGKEKFENFTGLNMMKFVEKRTADAVRSLKPETLSAVLAHYRLSEKEIKAACRRLVMLQNAMDYSHLGEKGVDIELDDNLYVLEKKQIQHVSTDSLIHAKGERNVNSLFGDMIRVVDKPIMPKLSENIEIPKAEIKNADSHFLITKSIEKMSAFVKELKTENEGMFVGSPEYRNVLAYAKLMQQELENMLDQQKDRRALNREKIGALFMTMNDLTTAYLDKKEEDSSLDTKERSRKRMLAVQHLKDYAENNAVRFGMAEEDVFSGMEQRVRRAAYHNAHLSKEISRRITELLNQRAVNRDNTEPKYFRLTNIFTTIANQSVNGPEMVAII